METTRARAPAMADLRLLDSAGLPGRLALAPTEAAAALGVGLTYFTETVAPELRVVRRGRRVLVPVAELVRWLEREGESVAETIEAQR
jgi:excisionase family DNA binding protein